MYWSAPAEFNWNSSRFFLFYKCRIDISDDHVCLFYILICDITAVHIADAAVFVARCSFLFQELFMILIYRDHHKDIFL